MSDTLKEKKKKRYMRYFFFAITKAPQARIRILLCIVTSNVIYVVEFLGLKVKAIWLNQKNTLSERKLIMIFYELSNQVDPQVRILK